MTRDEMIDNVIRKFGHESHQAIEFCRFCETYNQSTSDDIAVETLYNRIMNQ